MVSQKLGHFNVSVCVFVCVCFPRGVNQDKRAKITYSCQMCVRFDLKTDDI